MTDAEKLREFCERVKREHVEWSGSPTRKSLCAAEECNLYFPCDALKAVRVIEELLSALELCAEPAAHEVSRSFAVSDAFSKAASKVGEK